MRIESCLKREIHTPAKKVGKCSLMVSSSDPLAAIPKTGTIDTKGCLPIGLGPRPWNNKKSGTRGPERSTRLISIADMYWRPRPLRDLNMSKRTLKGTYYAKLTFSLLLYVYLRIRSASPPLKRKFRQLSQCFVICRVKKWVCKRAVWISPAL